MAEIQPLIPSCAEEIKHPLQSKTLIFNAVLGILPFIFPKIYSFIVGLPPDSQVQVVSGFFALANIGLRFISKARISFKKQVEVKTEKVNVDGTPR